MFLNALLLSAAVASGMAATVPQVMHSSGGPAQLQYMQRNILHSVNYEDTSKASNTSPQQWTEDGLSHCGHDMLYDDDHGPEEPREWRWDEAQELFISGGDDAGEDGGE